jgi:hypothetical protein
VDRESHEQIYEVPLTTISNADAEPTIEGAHTCPCVLGGFEWSSPSYNPTSNMLDLRETISFLDRSHKVVRIYIKKSAVVLRLQWTLATGLPQEVADMHAQVADLEAEPSSHAFADRLLLSLARSDISPMGGGGPKPSPSPSPTGGGGGGGSGRDLSGSFPINPRELIKGGLQGLRQKSQRVALR